MKVGLQGNTAKGGVCVAAAGTETYTGLRGARKFFWLLFPFGDVLH